MNDNTPNDTTQVFTIKLMPSAHLGSYGLAASLPDDGLWYPVIKEMRSERDIQITIYHDPKPTEVWAMQVALALCHALAAGAQVMTNAFVTQYKITKYK